MGERRRNKKQQSKAQQGSLPRQQQQKRLGVLHLQENAGNRAVSGLLGSLSGVPAPEIVRTPEGVAATVYFAKNSAFLDPANFRPIERLAEELRYLYQPAVEVDGHASGEGREARNQALSERRRQTVIALLTGQLKTPLKVKGDAFGESQPAVPEAAEAASELERQRAQNRRVEITIIYSRQESPPDIFDFNFSDLDPKPDGPFDFEPPPPIKRSTISISGEFDKKFNEVADGVLDKLNINKPWARAILKKGARAAIDKGLETALDEAMDEVGLKGETREALKTGLQAGLKFEW